MRSHRLLNSVPASDIEAAAAAGFDAHCAKPITIATLLAEIQKVRTA